VKYPSRITCLIALALAALFVAGCQNETTPVPEPTPSTVLVSQSDVAPGGRLRALGTILPAQQLKLSFLTGGLLRVVNVRVGSEINAGDLLAALDTTDSELSVQEAEDALAVSQAFLNQAQAGPLDEAVAVAEADYQAALARYEQVEAGASQDEAIIALAALRKAEVALQQAQAAYDQISWLEDAVEMPQTLALQQATLDYEAARAQYDLLKRLPTEAELREAQAQVSRAAAQLALAQVPPRTEDVAVAEAQIQQARTALARANLALAHSELLAPFDGTISAVYLHTGEWAAPGAPVVEILDTTAWLVETRNVGELNIGRVKVGQEAIVQVMAFRGEKLRGRVVAISPIAVVQQGDTTYTVMIELEPTDLNLRPGMNVEAEIVTE
jgi:HlyD family secretion protein